MTVKRDGTGQTAQFHDSGSVMRGSIASGGIGSGNIGSGQIGTMHIAPGAIVAASVGSGQIQAGLISSGAILSGAIASGQVGPNHIASGAIASGRLSDNSVSRNQIASGTRVWGTERVHVCGDLISGVRAVAFNQDGSIIPAERQSGLRLPAFGVTVSGGVSGDLVSVVTNGFIAAASGEIASGNPGRLLYVGSGGLIVSLSGFCDGPSSGAPFISGSVVQRIGICLSGGVYVDPDVTVRDSVFNTAQGYF